MMGNSSLNRGFSILLSAAALTILIQGIYQAQSVLASFLIAIFFAILGPPPVAWLEKKKVPTVLAVILVVTGMITIFLITGALVGASISSFSTELPAYQTRLQAKIATFQTFLATKGIRGVDKVLRSVFDPEAIMNLTGRLFSGLSSVFSNLVMLFLSVAFILFEASTFPDKLRAVVDHPQEGFPRFARFVSDMERYVVIHTLFSLMTGVLIGVWLHILGLDFPVLWAFLAFLLNYVPIVGSMIAAIPAILLALLQLGVSGAVLTTTGYLVVNFAIGNVIEVMFLGQKLGLSNLVVFLSLVSWGSLLGPVGMVLCIPLTMTLKFACENNDGTKWIAELLGPEATVKTFPTATQEGGAEEQRPSAE